MDEVLKYLETIAAIDAIERKLTPRKVRPKGDWTPPIPRNWIRLTTQPKRPGRPFRRNSSNAFIHRRSD